MNDNKIRKEYCKPLVSVIVMEDLLEQDIPIASPYAESENLMGKSHGGFYDDSDNNLWNDNESKSFWDD